MKKSILSLALFAMIAAGTAHADTAAPNHGDLFKFFFDCDFGEVVTTPAANTVQPPDVRCDYHAKIFRNIREDASTMAQSPEWVNDIFSLICNDRLIDAGHVNVVRQDDQDGVRFELWNDARTLEVDLKDHPFSDHDKTVDARLEFDHRHFNGHCDIKAVDVHGVDGNSSPLN